MRQPVTTRACFRVVFSVYASELLHLLDYFYRVFLDQGLVGQELILPAAAVELSRCLELNTAQRHILLKADFPSQNKATFVQANQVDVYFGGNKVKLLEFSRLDMHRRIKRALITSMVENE